MAATAAATTSAADRGTGLDAGGAAAVAAPARTELGGDVVHPCTPVIAASAFTASIAAGAVPAAAGSSTIAPGVRTVANGETRLINLPPPKLAVVTASRVTIIGSLASANSSTIASAGEKIAFSSGVSAAPGDAIAPTTSVLSWAGNCRGSVAEADAGSKDAAAVGTGADAGAGTDATAGDI